MLAITRVFIQPAPDGYLLSMLHFYQNINCIKCELKTLNISTQQKTHNLFWPDENSIEQCCAAHIVQGCQQYCSTLLHLTAGCVGRPTAG